MQKDLEYSAQQLLPILQQQTKHGVVVWEDGNLFYKVVTNLEKEFPSYENPKEKEIDGTKYIVLITGGFNDRYDCIWMLSTPETRAYFLK